MCSPEIPDDPNFQTDITNTPPTFARFLSFRRTTNSSSKWHKAEFARKVLDFGGDQSFCKDIGHHFFGGAVNESNLPLFNDPTDEMEAYIDVFRSSMVLVFFGECDC